MTKRQRFKQIKNDERVKKQVSRVCTYFAVVMPLTALPQVVQLYQSQDAGSLSLLMWSLGSVGVIPFILYGITHDMLQLVTLNTLWLAVNIIMISGIMMYN